MIYEPNILSANTFYWQPSQSADGRRRNETNRRDEARTYLKALGFELKCGDAHHVYGERWFDGVPVFVSFDYSETCEHVYKSLAVWKGENKSNITFLRKIAQYVDDMQVITAEVAKFRETGETLATQSALNEWAAILKRNKKRLGKETIADIKSVMDYIERMAEYTAKLGYIPE